MPIYPALIRQDQMTVTQFLSQRSLRPRIRNARTMIPALIQCQGIVHYTRSGTRTVVSSGDDEVERGDFLSVASQCGSGQVQTVVANPGTKDYAFVMSGGTFGTGARNYMNRRPSTAAITACTSFDSILRAICCPDTQSLALARHITTPIGNVFIVTHAGATGAFFCKLYNNSPRPQIYLDQFCPYVNDQNRTQVDTRHIKNNASTNIYIRGCNVGQEPRFLRYVKQIFGNQVTVTAPLHEDFFGHFQDGRTFYRCEYMRYCFKVLRNSPVSDKNSLVTLFDGLSATDIHGNRISTQNWNAWIPTNIHPTRDVVADYNCTIAFHARMKPDRVFRYTNRMIYGYDIRWSGPGPLPTARADRIALLRRALPGDPVMQANYPSQQCQFPMYQRWGYQNLTAFINGLDWSFTPVGTTLRCTGRRHEYEVRIPITDAQNTLLVNAFLGRGTRQYLPNSHTLLETNTSLFATV